MYLITNIWEECAASATDEKTVPLQERQGIKKE